MTDVGDGRSASRDDPLEQENLDRENDSQWVNQFVVMAVFLAVAASVGTVLAQGWHSDYPLSAIAGTGAGGLVLGLCLRRHLSSGTGGLPRAVFAALAVGLATDVVVVTYLPGARVPRLDALLLIASAVFAGLVLVSAEALLEYLVAGLAGLIIESYFRDGSSAFVRVYLACAVPMLVARLILPRLLKRHPGGLLDASLLPMLWTVVGQQSWSVSAFRPGAVWTYAALIVCVLLRVLLGRLSVRPSSKFAYLLSAFLIAAGIALIRA